MNECSASVDPRHRVGSRWIPWHRFDRGRVCRLCGLLACLPIAGCGPAPTLVSGRITLDGVPVEKATVQFFPVNGDSPNTHCFTQADGGFQAVVWPVPMKVTVKKPKVVGQTRMFPDSPLVDAMGESLPPRYSDLGKTELRVEPVASKTTVADFALTSEGP